MSINPLHDARVQRGISLHAIASTTRLSPRIVEALDKGRFTEIPAGIYARSYVRAFATAVGLDADVALGALGDSLPPAVELSPVVLEQVRSSPAKPGGATRIVQDATVDVAFLFSTSALLIAVVSEYCGVSSRALLHLAPGAVVGLCAPVWVVYEMLLGRLCAHRIFWSGSAFLIPSSIGILSIWGVKPRPVIKLLSSFFNSANVRAAAGSLMRFTRSPGSFLRS
jgi:hypothetical protein